VATGRRGENSHTLQGAADRSKLAAGAVALGLRPGRGSALFHPHRHRTAPSSQPVLFEVPFNDLAALEQACSPSYP
jgi:hypothetical protein